MPESASTFLCKDIISLPRILGQTRVELSSWRRCRKTRNQTAWIRCQLKFLSKEEQNRKCKNIFFTLCWLVAMFPLENEMFYQMYEYKVKYLGCFVGYFKVFLRNKLGFERTLWTLNLLRKKCWTGFNVLHTTRPWPR